MISEEVKAISGSFADYTNRWKFLTYDTRGDTSSCDDILISCEGARLRMKIGLWSDADDNQLWEAIDRRSRREYGRYESPLIQGHEPFQRSLPSSSYFALGWFKEPVAKAILRYSKGRKDSVLIGRPDLKCHLLWRCGETPNWYLRLRWALTVAFSSSMRDWRAAPFMIDVAGDKGALERWATRMWTARLKRTWGSLKGFYSVVFGPQHPVAKHCDD